MSEVTDTRDEQLNDVLSLIGWLKDHPVIPLPVGFSDSFQIYAWDTKDEAAQMAKAMGTCEKSYDDTFFRLIKKFGTVTLVGVFSRQQVCERVVVGTKEVEVEEADPVAVAAIPKVKVKKQIEIVEWKCPENLLGSNEAPLATEVAA